MPLPLNPGATDVVAAVLRGRPAVLHHYDLPWQRRRFAGRAENWPPDDPAWRHVTCNQLSRRQLAARGITAVVVPPGFDVDQPAGDRAGTRAGLGLGDGERLVLHPVRAIERKATRHPRWAHPGDRAGRDRLVAALATGPVAEPDHVAVPLAIALRGIEDAIDAVRDRLVALGRRVLISERGPRTGVAELVHQLLGARTR